MKKKLTPKEIEREWHAYNKSMRRIRVAPVSLEYFTRYVKGRAPRAPQPFRPLQTRPSPHDEQRARDRAVPSKTCDVSVTPGLKPSPVYTGTYVKGIATMHKSNAVPVVDDQHMIDIAHMRR